MRSQPLIATLQFKGLADAGRLDLQISGNGAFFGKLRLTVRMRRPRGQSAARSALAFVAGSISELELAVMLTR